ncbi:MAG: glycosyltransferase [Polaribacter sp.]|nr:glycosyltransferase [Polaribacter sp.]
MKKIHCLTPVYNDWESFEVLTSQLEALQKKHDKEYVFSLIAINDGSTEVNSLSKTSLNITLIHLKINIGHQRAIATGLQYIYNEIDDTDYVVVMDCDGEDKPEDIISLIEKAGENNHKKIIFAQRRKRQETVFFKFGYVIYKKLFKLFTGQKISFGNFSVIPEALLSKVVHQNNIWNHFSGGVIQSKIPFDKVLLDRGKRFHGASKMNFYNLTIHGLSSISVYFDFLSLRILKFTLYGILLCAISIFYILYQKIFTDNAIPGWASSLTLILTGIMLQLFTVTLIVLLLQLSSRKNIAVPNSKTYVDFIESKDYYHKNLK